MKTPLGIILIVIALIILLIAGAVYWFIIKPKMDAEKEKENTGGKGDYYKPPRTDGEDGDDRL